MKTLRNLKTAKKQKGATVLEYAMLLVLILVVAIPTLFTLGQTTNAGLNSVNDAMTNI